MGKTHKQSIFDDKFLFQKAYKKLKLDAYYDKTKVILSLQSMMIKTFCVSKVATYRLYWLAPLILND